MMTMDWATQQKLVDPYNFVKAEDYFQNLDRVASGGQQASTVASHLFNSDARVNKRRLLLHFDNGRAILLRFVRPRAWHMRCNYDPQSDLTEEEGSTYVKGS